MELDDAIDMIREGIESVGPSQEWADLGCGSGLFTRSLCRILPDGSRVHAVDRKPVSLPHREAEVEMIPWQLDFGRENLPFAELDGILMANSLHFIHDKSGLIEKLIPCFKNRPRLIVIEYDTRDANPWVPYPVSYDELRKLLEKHAFSQIREIGERPSRYGHRRIYAALAQA